MSKPTDGTYIIVNRVLSANGTRLAISFNGEGKSATLAPASSDPAQRVRFILRVTSPSFCDLILFEVDREKL